MANTPSNSLMLRSSRSICSPFIFKRQSPRVDFGQKIVELCISDHADGVWRRFRKPQSQSHASVFQQVEVVGFCKICHKVKGIERVATFIVLARYEIALVSVYLVGADKKFSRKDPRYSSAAAVLVRTAAVRPGTMKSPIRCNDEN